MARPSTYSYKLCVEICTRVSNGENIRQILLSKEKYPNFQTFCNWKRKNPELLDLYARSRENKSEIVDSQIDEIMADLRNGKIDAPTARVLIDTLKWKAAKYYPKMFGDKVDVTSDGDKIQSISVLGMPDFMK